METYYATFGSNHKNEGKVQPIVAYDLEHAKRKMFEKYGSEWAFVYEEEVFMEDKESGLYKGVEELPLLSALYKITFGEMQALTERFNQIIGGAQTLKEKRLRQMRRDLIELAKTDDFALQMWFAVDEEIREEAI